MGNDNSRLKGLVIDKRSVDANDFWTLYNAEMPTSRDEGKQMLSVFQGEPVVTGQLWVTQGPMERAIKNSMIYRHPYILKYIATWEQGAQKYLATERVRPLLGEVNTLSDIQVCLGLRTILCGLIFLIEKAQARHLNICMSSINIAIDGSWRLAGFEYVWKSTEVTKKLLDLASSYRYKKGIDPHEMQSNNIEYIEQYAFATLCEEILSKMDKPSDAATPYIQDFRVYCSTHLKHKNPQMRPSLSAVLLHPYFNHEFVLIHSFLIELPLKSLSEKQEFFTSLIDRLRCFEENIVGAQLSELLLSRMVLLDPTAQFCVTPYVLRTKNNHPSALFSAATYTHYLLPHINKNFRLRDAQIRLILLEYFMEFVSLLSKEELQHFVLPHLQAGLRDTNDVLVAKTMRCLADLVPILGSQVVVGGERMRIFSDGRPQAASTNSTTHWVEPRSITPVMGGDTNSLDCIVSGSPVPFEHNESGNSLNSLLTQSDTKNSEQHQMPPRLSPDGGEDDKISCLVIDGLIEIPEDRELTTNSSPFSEKNMISINTIDRKTDEIINTSSPQTANSDNLFLIHSLGEEDEPWSDWETDELQRPSNCSEGETNILASNTASLLSEVNTSKESDILKKGANITSQTSSLKTNSDEKIDDLNALDITVKKITTRSANHADSYDFFKDMEPVIETRRNNTDDFHVTLILPVPSNNRAKSNIEETLQESEEEVKIDTSRFAAIISNDNATCLADANGWGAEDDEVGWGTTA